MPAAAEWVLQPSRQQQRLYAVLLVLLGSFLLLLWPLIWAFGALLMTGIVLWRLRLQAVSRIGLDDRGWWLQQNEKRRYVNWRGGSIRRRHVVVLNWSFWPWHSLVIRADSVRSADDFRRLKAALYQSWH